MPPKPKFSRTEIIDAALDVVRDKGIEALTARELAEQLGSSTRPIFTAFSDMDELRIEVRRMAAARIERESMRTMHDAHSFPEAEMRAIYYAIHEPNLYHLAFMTGAEEQRNLEGVIRDNEVTIADYVSFLRDTYDVSAEGARLLFKHAWVFTFGVGAMFATQRYIEEDEQQVQKLLEDDFNAMLACIKSAKQTGMPLDFRATSWVPGSD